MADNLMDILQEQTKYTGKTSKGFKFEVEASRLDNMELVDALADLDGGNVLVVSKLVTMMLGKEQKKKLYDFYRTEKGNVPIADISQAIVEIMSANKATKN